jgi:hypothetical protein
MKRKNTKLILILLIVYSSIFTIPVNSLKSFIVEKNKILSQKSSNEASTNTANEKQTLPDYNFLEKSQTELESELELSPTDYLGNIEKIVKKDEEIGKGLYDYFNGEVHKKENPYEFNNKYRFDSLKNKIEKNGYQLYENLINLVQKQPDKIMKADTHKMMHFSEHEAKFKEVISGLSKAEKSFKFKQENNYNDDNNNNNKSREMSVAPFEDGPIDFGNFSFNGFLG